MIDELEVFKIIEKKVETQFFSTEEKKLKIGKD